MNVADVLLLFECLLCFNAWCDIDRYWSVKNEEQHMADASASISQLLMTLQTTIPRNKGHGWNISKMHDLQHCPRDIQRHGKLRN